MRTNVFLIVLFVFLISLYAAPYYTEEILINARDFTNFSGWFNGNIGWFEDGTAIYSNWSTVWVEYQAYLTAGTWHIGVNATNVGSLGPTGWYDNFVITNSLTGANFNVQASDSQVYGGYFVYNVTTAGTYTVRYTWTNDQCNSGYDANMKLTSVFFDNPATVPEPMNILTIAFVGICFFIRRKQTL